MAIRSALAVLLLAGVVSAQLTPPIMTAKGTPVSAATKVAPVAATAAPVAAPKSAVPLPATGASKTALAAIEANNDLSLFRTLLEVAGLDPYLESPVTRATVFAPTNAAIKKLATAMKLTPEQLIADYNHLLVDRLVGYHVVTTADIKSKAITDGAKITTAGGGELTADLKTKAGAVMIKGAQNSAQVTAADTVVGNVTIHVIDSVLLPATVFPTIKDALAFSPTTSALSAALNKDPKLAKLIADPTTNITLFAPTTAALTALGEDAKAKALLADPVSANKILAYHAMKGARIEPSFMGKGAEVQPTLLEGQSVTISKVVTPKATGNIGTVTVLADSAGAKPVAIKKHNIIAGASLINVIDGVLIPKL